MARVKEKPMSPQKLRELAQEFKEKLPEQTQIEFQVLVETIFKEEEGEYSSLSTTVPTVLKQLVEGMLKPSTSVMGKPRKGDIARLISELWEQRLEEFYGVDSAELVALSHQIGSYDREDLQRAIEFYKQNHVQV